MSLHCLTPDTLAQMTSLGLDPEVPTTASSPGALRQWEAAMRRTAPAPVHAWLQHASFHALWTRCDQLASTEEPVTTIDGVVLATGRLTGDDATPSPTELDSLEWLMDHPVPRVQQAAVAATRRLYEQAFAAPAHQRSPLAATLFQVWPRLGWTFERVRSDIRGRAETEARRQARGETAVWWSPLIATVWAPLDPTDTADTLPERMDSQLQWLLSRSDASLRAIFAGTPASLWADPMWDDLMVKHLPAYSERTLAWMVARAPERVPDFIANRACQLTTQAVLDILVTAPVIASHASIRHWTLRQLVARHREQQSPPLAPRSTAWKRLVAGLDPSPSSVQATGDLPDCGMTDLLLDVLEGEELRASGKIAAMMATPMALPDLPFQAPLGGRRRFTDEDRRPRLDETLGVWAGFVSDLRDHLCTGPDWLHAMKGLATAQRGGLFSEQV